MHHKMGEGKREGSRGRRAFISLDLISHGYIYVISKQGWAAIRTVRIPGTDVDDKHEILYELMQKCRLQSLTRTESDRAAHG